MSLQTVHWIVRSTNAPHIIVNCHTCKIARRFASSGKFRLNANGKRLDAWLVYNCVHCSSSWNLTVFERKHVREIESGLLEKLQLNDATLADSIARTTPLSRIFLQNEGVGAEYSVEKDQLELSAPCQIMISVPEGRGPRLDRLLADQLGLSRSAIVKQVKADRMQIAARTREPLRRPVADGTIITLM